VDETCDLVFLYQLVDGVVNNSHALYTAKRAGVPQEILDRAAQVSQVKFIEQQKS